MYTQPGVFSYIQDHIQCECSNRVSQAILKHYVIASYSYVLAIENVDNGNDIMNHVHNRAFEIFEKILIEHTQNNIFRLP